MSFGGPICRFLIPVFVLVVSRFIPSLTIIMAVARPLFRRCNNFVDNQHQQKRLQQLKKCEGTLDNDSLSELPNEILIHIISFLTMKEAGRTCLLSKRWRHLWTHIPTLIFESRKMIDDCILHIKSFKVQGPKYLHWVDRVISLYEAPTVNEVSVQFAVDRLGSNSYIIDNLFKFSMEKKVKRLQVDLSLADGCFTRSRHTFKRQSSCNSLTSLALACVNITGEILESFLCNCQALEYLSVEYSDTLLGFLKVNSKSLKTLIIYRCYGIEQLEIFAPNLMSVCYFGPKINVEFKSTPMLAEVSFGQSYAKDWGNGFSDLSGYLSQIEVLSLSPYCILESIIISGEDLVFSRLKKLDLDISPSCYEKLDCFEYLLTICPVLHHFKLQLSINEMETDDREGIEKKEAFHHHHLKILEIVGFVGYPIDLAIAAFLIESAVLLEKIIIDPRETLLIGTVWEFKETPEKIHAKEQAKLLGTDLKPTTELQIL